MGEKGKENPFKILFISVAIRSLTFFYLQLTMLTGKSNVWYVKDSKNLEKIIYGMSNRRNWNAILEFVGAPLSFIPNY